MYSSAGLGGSRSTATERSKASRALFASSDSRRDARLEELKGGAKGYICSEYVQECYARIGIEIEGDARGFVAPADFAGGDQLEMVAVLERPLRAPGRRRNESGAEQGSEVGSVLEQALDRARIHVQPTRRASNTLQCALPLARRRGGLARESLLVGGCRRL